MEKIYKYQRQKDPLIEAKSYIGETSSGNYCKLTEITDWKKQNVKKEDFIKWL